MSVAVVKDKRVTVVTAASDCKTLLLHLWQILKNLCCCSAHKGVMRPSVVSALAAIQIMVGLFNIGMGPGHTSKHFAQFGAAYWLGAGYITAGIMSVLSGWSPSTFMVVAVLVNIAGSVFAILGISLYAIDLGGVSVAGMCGSYGSDSDDNCLYLAYIAERMWTAMDITMIVLAVLQLCVNISFAVLGIKALKGNTEEDDGTLKCNSCC